MARKQLGTASAVSSDLTTRGEVLGLVGNLKSCRFYVASDASLNQANASQPLNSGATFNSDTTLYSFNGGGIQVATAGLYLVVAAIFTASGGGTGYRNINVRVGSTFGTGGTVVGEASGFNTGGELRVTATFVVNIGATQVVTLCVATDTNFTLKAGNSNSWMSLVKIG